MVRSRNPEILGHRNESDLCLREECFSGLEMDLPGLICGKKGDSVSWSGSEFFLRDLDRLAEVSIKEEGRDRTSCGDCETGGREVWEGTGVHGLSATGD